MASDSVNNQIHIWWAGSKQELAELQSHIKEKNWFIQPCTLKSMGKKLTVEGTHIVLLPLWAEGLSDFLSEDYGFLESTEFLLVRRSDEWQEMSQTSLPDIINSLRVRGVIQWPLVRENFLQLIDKRLGGQEVGPRPSALSRRRPDVVDFVKRLSKSMTAEELLILLRDELKNEKNLGEPILAFFSDNQPKLLSFQGHQLVAKSLNEVWPQSLRLRNSDRKDQDYLSRQLGRPVLNSLAIPMVVHGPEESRGLLCSANLFFEHSLQKEEVDDFMAWVGERLQPFTTTLDRILLESDLKSAARTWSMTFDGISDAVAIYDEEIRVLRSNQMFFNLFGQTESPELTSILRQAFQDGQATTQPLNFQSRSFEVRLYPIRWSPQDRPTTFVSHFIDVTEAVTLQGQMIQNEKMVAVGHLAGNIAHELNNPLTGIRSLAQVILADPSSLTEQQVGDLQDVELAAQRCQEIINNLLEFSHTGADSRAERVSLNSIVERTLPLLKAALKSHQCDVELSESDQWVSVDVSLMQQVVFNLVNNACQAMGDSGALKISTGQDQQMGFISVRDFGPGIPEGIRHKIFENFFTTKDPGQGTGLGLSMSQKIVQKFGGQIDLKTEVGAGTTFVVRLPLSELEASL